MNGNTQKEKKMKKVEYGFSARYQDVDFDRIVEENPDADFIRIEWTTTNRRHVQYLATRSGIDRLLAVDLPIGDPDIFKIKCDGVHRFEGYSQGTSNFNWITLAGEGTPEERFKRLYAKLREREERRHQVRVTAIN